MILSNTARFIAPIPEHSFIDNISWFTDNILWFSDNFLWLTDDFSDSLMTFSDSLIMFTIAMLQVVFGIWLCDIFTLLDYLCNDFWLVSNRTAFKESYLLSRRASHVQKINERKFDCFVLIACSFFSCWMIYKMDWEWAGRISSVTSFIAAAIGWIGIFKMAMMRRSF